MERKKAKQTNFRLFELEQRRLSLLPLNSTRTLQAAYFVKGFLFCFHAEELCCFIDESPLKGISNFKGTT